jgi:GH35 family endo-1,4-beta-xylanase
MSHHPRLTNDPSWRLVTIPLRTLLLALLVAVLAAVPASASRNQMLTFEAPRDLTDPAARDAALAKMDSLGVKAIRQVLYWKDVAPNADSSSKPDFDTTDPGNYDWSKYEPILDAAKERGWKVLLTISGPVPRWATDKRKDNVTRPDASEFAQFTEAVAKHYGDRVSMWSIWNEPNHPQFLKPQYDRKHRPVSPRLYRELFKAALKGFKGAGLKSPTVLMGETAPVGTGRDVAPITFLRGALCLNSRWHLTKGCRRLDADGYAHHAYTTRLGPFYKPASRNNVTIGVLSRLTRALDRAGRAKAIRKGMPIYLTEFGIQSKPDPQYGVSYQRQAEYRAISERIAYDNRRVKSFSQYLLRDDNPIPNVPALARYGGFESGLETAGGKKKPSFDAFRLTLAGRHRGSRTTLWGLVRPAAGVTQATLSYRNGSKGSFRKLATVTTNKLGYFSRRTSYRKSRQYELTWTAPDGTKYSGTPIRAYR